MSSTGPAAHAPTTPDPFENDPFFKRIPDGQWNACIGRQGHHENYVDGYIEAAIELVDAIFEKKLFGKRDTLVLPILYNARHAIELTQKFAISQLSKAGVITTRTNSNHDIMRHWERLHECKIGDEELAKTIEALKPYVESLSRIDSDGQELRYPRNRDEGLSLAAYSVANLRLIRISLRALEKIIARLKYRTMDYVAERATGTYTSHCSRADLLAIAHMIPRRSAWDSPEFDTQKAAVKTRFGLSNKQFSLALDRIQDCRETRSILGLESPLVHLTDDDITFVVQQWRSLHPSIERDQDDSELDYFDPKRLSAMREDGARRKAAVDAISERLSASKLAELETMFYLDRDRVFVEEHEAEAERRVKGHAIASDPKGEILHLMEKINFLACLQSAAQRLGRLALAERLRTI